MTQGQTTVVVRLLLVATAMLSTVRGVKTDIRMLQSDWDDVGKRAVVLAKTYGMNTNATATIRIQASWPGNDSMNAANTKYPITIALLNTLQLANVDETPDSAHYCYLPSLWKSTLPVSADTPAEFTATFTSSEPTQITLVAIDCEQNRTPLNGSVTFVNPGGQHLSLEEVPKVGMFGLLFACYLSTTVLWLGALLKNRRHRVQLQYVVTLAFIFKILEMLSQWQYHKTLSEEGVATHNTRTAVNLLELSSTAVFLGVQLLVAVGWSTTRPSLPERERHLIIASLGCYLLFGMLYSTSDNANLKGGYLLAFYVIKFLITFGIIVAMNSNIEKLLTTPLEPHMSHRDIAIFYSKLGKFQKFRIVFLAYLVIPILLLFVSVTVLSWQQQWVMQFLQQLLVFAVVCVLALIFRPSEADPPSYGHRNMANNDENGGRPAGPLANARDGSAELEGPFHTLQT